jgi:hypothetical protein
MRILVVTLLYMPDGGPSAPLYGMLCEELAQRGHAVSGIAAVPRYPSGRVPREFGGRLIRRSREKGVNIFRVFVPSLNRTSLWQRLIQFLFYQLNASLAGLGQQYDVELFGNPALVFWLPFTLLYLLRSKPMISSVHDVLPDVGVTLSC